MAKIKCNDVNCTSSEDIPKGTECFEWRRE